MFEVDYVLLNIYSEPLYLFSKGKNIINLQVQLWNKTKYELIVIQNWIKGSLYNNLHPALGDPAIELHLLTNT